MLKQKLIHTDKHIHSHNLLLGNCIAFCFSLYYTHCPILSISIDRSVLVWMLRIIVFDCVFATFNSKIEVVLNIELQQFACGVSKRWNILIIHYHYTRNHLHAFQFPHKCVHSAIPFYNNAKIAFCTQKHTEIEWESAKKTALFFYLAERMVDERVR